MTSKFWIDGQKKPITIALHKNGLRRLQTQLQQKIRLQTRMKYANGNLEKADV